MSNSISGLSSNDYLAYLLQSASAGTASSLTASSSATSSSGVSAAGPMSASDMFSKLTSDLGGDGKTITKDQLESYINKVESDTTGTYDKGSLGFLNQLDSNWNSISGGSDSITESQLSSGMSYLQPPTQGGNMGSLSSDTFSALADAVGSSSSSSVSKDDLTSYLESLLASLASSASSSSTSSTTDSDDTTSATKVNETSGTTSKTSTSSSTDSATSTSSTEDTSLTKEIAFIKNLVENFDDYSNGNNSMSSRSFYSAMKQPQDPSTVTSEQLVSPIDLRV